MSSTVDVCRASSVKRVKEQLGRVLSRLDQTTPALQIALRTKDRSQLDEICPYINSDSVNFSHSRLSHVISFF